MKITNSTIQDIDLIFDFYEEAITFQKTVFDKAWESFERSLIKTEIEERRQWKILIENEVAGIFATTLSDPDIWGEKDKQPSIYIHRIVTNSKFRGANLVGKIIEWAKDFCHDNNRQFIRIDTWGDNPKLLNYYEKRGFRLVDKIDISKAKNLPIHYKGLLARMEIEV